MTIVRLKALRRWKHLAVTASRWYHGRFLAHRPVSTISCPPLLPLQVSALGHSAGAHMWAMVLLERARAAGRKASQTSSDGSKGALGQLDTRMPARFIGGDPLVGWHLSYLSIITRS